MSLCPPGEDLGTLHGDIRLNQRARQDGGPETDVFVVTEETGTLNIRCKVCEMTIFGVRNLNSHIAGKKHQGKFSSKTWVLVDDSEPEPNFSLPEPVSAVSTSKPLATSSKSGQKSAVEVVSDVDKSKVFQSSDGPLQKVLEGTKDPVIGVEYLIEIREDGYRSNPAVLCLLCSKELECSSARGHLTSATHRLLYLECFFPIVRRKFAKVPNLSFWERSTFDFLESIVSRIEARLGRLQPWTVQGRHFLEMEMESIRKMVENGSHFKETVGLNFRTIPDPFGSYLFKLPKNEVLDISIMPDPKGKPGLDLSVPYHQQIALGGAGVDHGQELAPGDNSEKSNVLYKIANLRKEIKKDEKYVNHMKKLRDDVKDSKSKDGPNPKQGLDEVSDEELPSERNLKLRRPDKRGIRSRNPDGLASRRDRDREERDGVRGDFPRELHMDRELKERGRRGTRDEGGSGRGDDHWRDRRRDERHGRRSRSRSRSRERRRDRSVSPFVLAMEKWKRFKKAEGVMLSNISNRKDIFDKRPEDHPKYGEEWKLFWEKRYKELQAQGKDPNNHDFKAEWIPFWTKRVTQMFDTEVLEKTNDLMKKFELATVTEPKREDFVKERKGSPDKKEKRSPERREKRSPRRDRRGSRSPGRKGWSRNHSPQDKRTVRDVGYDFDSRQSSYRDGRDIMNNFGHHGMHEPDLRENRDRGGRNMEEPRDRRQGHQRNMSPGDSRGNIRNPSPPGAGRARIHDQGKTGPNRMDSNRSDMYSGITELEDRRDRGRSGSPLRMEENKLTRGREFHLLDDPQMGVIKVIPCLRLLTALEDSLGSLGPQINQVLAKALSLEQSREGASKVLLEDPDTVSILDMVKEKLSGQMAAGLLEGSKEGAVRVCLDNLNRLLQNATKKRSLNPSSLLNIKEQTPTASNHSDNAANEEAVKALISQSVATVLMMSGKDDISDQELENLVEQLMKQTAEEDHDSAVGRFAKSFSESLILERQLAARSANQFNIYNTPHFNQPIKTEPTTITIDDDVNQDGGDELDDLTIDELRSLLNSFKNLSKQEQGDLISYMKKLETTNPEKVRRLREGMRQTEHREEGVQGDGGRDWSPVRKRSRRLSGSDLDMNPTAPAPAQMEQGGADRGEGEWEVEEVNEMRGTGGRRMERDNNQIGRTRGLDYGVSGPERDGYVGSGAGSYRDHTMHGNRGRQMAAFGSQVPRGGGEQGGEWQIERDFRGRREEGPSNHARFGEERSGREREWQGGSGW